MSKRFLRRSCVWLSLLPLLAPAQESDVPFRKRLPEKLEKTARYLFYLHGGIIETKGIRPTDPNYGTYEYEAILKTFEKRGFVVLSEAHPPNTDAQK